MNELGEKGIEALSEEFLEGVSGGQITDSGLNNDSVTIGWGEGDQMRFIWSIVEGYASVFKGWGYGLESVKETIKFRAQEHYKASIARYVAAVAGSVTISRAGGIKVN